MTLWTRVKLVSVLAGGWQGLWDTVTPSMLRPLRCSEDPAPKSALYIVGVSSGHILQPLLFLISWESEAHVPILSPPPVWLQAHAESTPNEGMA